MAATEKLGQQFQQLPMFMSARELKEGGAVPLPGDVERVQKIVQGRQKSDRKYPDRPPSEEMNQLASMNPTDALWAYKKSQSVRSGLHADIAENQVQTPIRLHAHGVNPEADARFPDLAIMNGHHRIASSYDINPDRLLPVTHTSWNRAGDWSDEMEAIKQADDRAWEEMAARRKGKR